MAATARVYCQSLWARRTAEAQFGSLVFEREVALVLDDPVGSAASMLSLLDPPVVVITDSISDYYLQGLLEFKPAALLLEPVTPERVAQTLLLVSQGERLAPPDLDPLKRLTAQERLVARLLLRGLSDKAIAAEMGLEPKTVSNIVASIRHKMGVENRTQIVLEYLGYDTKQHRKPG